MLLHNNTIATAAFLSATECPSSTASVFPHPQTPSTNQFFPNLPPPWIQQQYSNQRLLTEQYFVRILFILYSFLQIFILTGVREIYQQVIIFL
jgi:hypothetical protein